MSKPTLDSELVDDLLYAARHNDPKFLEESLNTLFSSHSTHPKGELLRAAADEYTGNTAIHMAAANGHLDILKTLTSHFPQPHSKSTSPANIQNLSGNTPLHYSAVNGHLAVCKFFVETCAGDLGIKNEAGKSVLSEAEAAEKDEVVAWGLGTWDDVENVDGEEKDTSPEEVAEDLEKTNVGEGSSKQSNGV